MMLGASMVGRVRVILFGSALIAFHSTGTAVAQVGGNNSSYWSTIVQPARQQPDGARALRTKPSGKHGGQDVVIQHSPNMRAPASGDQAAPARMAADAPAATAETKASSQTDGDTLDTTVLEYCRNIQPVADEARAAFLQQSISAMEQQLERKTADLEVRVAELKEWVSKRQQLIHQANASLVQMFAKMRPEAAAQQIAIMDEKVAAALLMKLDAKAASALLTEVPPPRAARLTAIIAGIDESPKPTGSLPLSTSSKRQEEQGRK